MWTSNETNIIELIIGEGYLKWKKWEIYRFKFDLASILSILIY